MGNPSAPGEMAHKMRRVLGPRHRRSRAAMTARKRRSDAVSEDLRAPDRIRTCGLKLRNPVPCRRWPRTGHREAISDRSRNRSGPSAATLMATDPRSSESAKGLEIR